MSLPAEVPGLLADMLAGGLVIVTGVVVADIAIQAVKFIGRAVGLGGGSSGAGSSDGFSSEGPDPWAGYTAEDDARDRAAGGFDALQWGSSGDGSRDI